MSKYDINFIGHLCFDETIQDDGRRSKTCGGAALYGAIAAASLGKKVAVELKLAERDTDTVEILREKGIDVFVIPAAETTQVRVSYRDGNVDERQIVTIKYAGVFSINEVKLVPAKHLHLAGCNDHEYSLDFIKAVRNNNASLSIDMQSFVRNNNPETGEMSFKDDPNKLEVVALMDKIKLDVLEADLLCGTNDLEKAAKIIQSWGCPEVMITRSDGVLIRYEERSYFEKFTHKSTTGRTGRGDTTFGAYLASRVDHKPEEALKYAAALASLKMEKAGPFSGTLEDVLAKIKTEIDEK